MRQRLGFLYVHRACQGWLSLLMAYQMAEFFFGGRQYRKQKFLLCKSGSLKCIVDIKIKNPQSTNPYHGIGFNYFVFVVAQVVHQPVSWDWFFIHQRGIHVDQARSPILLCNSRCSCRHPAEAMVNDVAGTAAWNFPQAESQWSSEHFQTWFSNFEFFILAILIPDHGSLSIFQKFSSTYQ